MSSASSNFTYQQNAYFGIFYPGDLISTVLDLCKTNPRFADLGNDDAEVTIGDDLLFASTNSDMEGACSVGFIAVDEMTYEGPDKENPEDTWVDLEPADMEKRETNNKKAVNAITDIYEFLIKEFKIRKIPVNKLYIGWRSVTCTWDLDGSSSSDSPAPEKKTSGKKSVPKPAKTPKKAEPVVDQPKTNKRRGIDKK